MTPAYAAGLSDAELDASLVSFFAADPPKADRRVTDNDRRSLVRWFGEDRRS